MEKSYSAGGVVVSAEGNVLVVSQGTSWSLPKGHVEHGETERQAAEREIKEESGVTDLEFVKKLGSYERFKIAISGVGEDTASLKHITMFLFTTNQQALRPQDPHNPEARWIAPGEVVNLLTHPKDKEFFESVPLEVERLLVNFRS
jgi:ADP-ribose pyrophosphatase YjhB (NUDIX family)